MGVGCRDWPGYTQGSTLSLAFLWVPVSCSVACTDFLKGRGEKKGTLARVLAPKRAL